MRRVTLDTNIYVSAFEFGGRTQLILDLALSGDLEVAVSQPIIAVTGDKDLLRIQQYDGIRITSVRDFPKSFPASLA